MAGANAPLRLAEVRLDGIDVGIAASAVVQALPVPAGAPALPRRAGALAGVVEHGGALVPVVDLARWVDTGARDDAPDARILILQDAGRVLGLRVSSVGGLVDVAPDAVTRLHHDDDAEEVFHSAARSPETGRILSVLDVGRLAALAQAWSDGAAAAAAAVAAPAAAAAAGAATRTYALLDAGAVRLGVPAAGLAEVIPMPPAATVAGGHGAWCTWRGRHLAIVPLAAVVPDTPDMPDDADAAPLLAVLEQDGLALGVPVRATLRLAQCVPPATGAAVATIYDEDGAELQLLELAPLFARRPEAALSRATHAGSEAPGSRTDGTAAGKPNDAAYVVFEADGLAAVPLGTLERILPLAGPPGATLPWDGRAIPVVDLRRPDAASASPSGGQVLVVRAEAGHVACVVAHVHLMIPAGAGRMYRLGATAFVTTDDGAAQASYRTVDLAAYAAPRHAA